MVAAAVDPRPAPRRPPAPTTGQAARAGRRRRPQSVCRPQPTVMYPTHASDSPPRWSPGGEVPTHGPSVGTPQQSVSRPDPSHGCCHAGAAEGGSRENDNDNECKLVPGSIHIGTVHILEGGSTAGPRAAPNHRGGGRGSSLPRGSSSVDTGDSSGRRGRGRRWHRGAARTDAAVENTARGGG